MTIWKYWLTGLHTTKPASLEAVLIRKRLRENIDKFSATDSIEKQLEKSGLYNKNRGRVKERWTSDNPLEEWKDKMHKKPKNLESWAGSKKGQGLSNEAETIRKKAGVHH